jgi:hypothetical protein
MNDYYGPSPSNLTSILVRTISKLEEITDQREYGLRNLIANAEFWIKKIDEELQKRESK